MKRIFKEKNGKNAVLLLQFPFLYGIIYATSIADAML